MERLFLPVSLALYIKRIILVIVLLIPCANTYAQGISNLWILGYDSGLPPSGCIIDFSSGNADTSFVNKSVGFRQTCASICNSNGDLLFYTNGICIANSLHDTMPNGDGLNPTSYTSSVSSIGLKIPQGDLILPIPLDSNRYYLFHESVEYILGMSTYEPTELLYSLIDMTLDNGDGDVVFKNMPIISDTLLWGGLTACKHANGRDWWIICHRYDSDIYYTLLLTPYGIDGPFTQHIGQYIYKYGGDQSVFSPDGRKFARYHAFDGLDIFDFDRCSGLLSNYVHIPTIDSLFGGASFSPNSRYLYISSTINLRQYDVLDTNIALTEQLVGVYDNFYDSAQVLQTTFYLSHLAQNGKIYINSTNSTRYLHVINSPDSAGLACNFTQHSLRLPSYNAFTIPNYPNFFLGADTTSAICDSLHVGIEKPKLSGGVLQIVYQPSWQYAYIHGEELEGKTFSLSVFDLSGRGVFKEEGKLSSPYLYMELNYQLFASGMYIVSLQTEKEKLVKRFVVE